MKTETLGCANRGAGATGDREVSRFSRVRLSPGLSRFWPSGRRQTSGRRPLDSDRFALAAARRRDPLAAILLRAVASEPLRYGRSSHGRGRIDGRDLRARALLGGQFDLLSRANSLRPPERFLQMVAFVLYSADGTELQDPAAMAADRHLRVGQVCVRNHAFSPIYCCSGSGRNLNSVGILSTAQAVNQDLKLRPKRTSHYRPVRDGATLGLRIQRLRGQR